MLSVGAGVIGDIYRLEERGTAMGKYLMVCGYHALPIHDRLMVLMAERLSFSGRPLGLLLEVSSFSYFVSLKGTDKIP